ncbi:MAG: cupredoxin domain-containing protein [Anaerolineales bacterium]|jgi:plastocyanin
MNKHFSGIKFMRIVFGLLIVTVMLLVACQPTAPTAETSTGDTAVTTQEPTEISTEQPMIVPSVMVSDQKIVNNIITITKVISDGPGWIVIHTQGEGAPGPVIGHAAVSDGTNSDVKVEIDVESATETLYAMLLTDDGVEGEYEFPGEDGPVSVEGEIVTPPFQVTGGLMMTQASVTVEDQAIKDGTITVTQVVSNGSGWIVIHAQGEGAPGPVIGHAAVSDGTNSDVKVEVDVESATETLYAMLHTDTGVEGEYEFPGEDGPVSVEGEIVTPPFQVTGGLMMTQASVTVEDQAIKDGTITVAQVVSNGSGWIVIHAQGEGAPGPVIGHAAVSDGTNSDVKVEVDVESVTETLYAMLHTDTGVEGEYEFPGEDGPVSVDGEIVTPAFRIVESMEETGGAGDIVNVIAGDSFFDAKTVTVTVGTTVVWENGGNRGHTVTSDDGVFNSGNLNSGDTFEFTFEDIGEYPYYCDYHGGPGGVGMAGIIIVTKN